MTPRSARPPVRPSPAGAAAVPRARPLAAVALLVAAGLVLTGCSAADESSAAGALPSASSTPTSAAATPSAAPAATPSAAPAAPTPAPVESVITMVGFEYEVPASVRPGAQVTVVNSDAEAHTFTLQGGPEVRLIVPPRGRMTFTAPAQPGTYPVVCEFHGGMTTSLVVA